MSMKDLKLQGLKSHDCHVLMQQLLPIAIRYVLKKHVKEVVIRLCLFFNLPCSSVVDVSTLKNLQAEHVVTLCLLEKCFPPFFFDIMIHFIVHLVNEIRLCGPVYLRWMYPFERYMKTLKSFVWNHNYLEGCIAESYIAEEVIEFCVEYMSNMNTVGFPIGHVQSLSKDKPLSGGKVVQIPLQSLDQAHLYILHHTQEVVPYIR